MTTQVAELYQALRAAGVSDDLASKAAAAVIGAEDKAQLVTKADLRAALAELKADLTWRMVVLTGVGIAAISALKVFG